MRWLALTAMLAACDSRPSAGFDASLVADLAVAADAASADAALLPDFAVAKDAAVMQANRDRLLQSYVDYLTSTGANPGGVCDLWNSLPPSARDVFLTLTARMQGSRLGDDGSFMLDHVVKIYRLSGGQGATATSAGSCGGGEYNRMIMSMDAHLQAALLSANTHQGAKQPNGAYDLADVTTFWRDSHDAAGPHAPFDVSDETDGGAPRGQVQYFRDPASAAANAPLGRMDLTTLIDPLALEMDQDYDCAHNSNPDCSYTFYGTACLPQATKLGVDLYTSNYGSIDPAWRPSGC